VLWPKALIQLQLHLGFLARFINELCDSFATETIDFRINLWQPRAIKFTFNDGASEEKGTRCCRRH